MAVKYLLKEAKYYKKLGKGHFKRMLLKFLFAKTPVKKIVNTPAYNKVYSKVISRKISKLRPYLLQIENTNLCNAKCIMCPHTIMKRKAKTMNQQDFEKIVTNVLSSDKIKTVTITGFGEPLIDKGIAEKIKWLNDSSPEINIDIYTNASLLTKELSEELLKLKIHKINFSINGTKKSYGKIMGLDYGKTQENILYFLNRKKELRLKFPLTNISLMVLKENEEEIKEVINFWKDQTDSIMAYLPSDWAGSLKGINFVNNDTFKKKRWPCNVLWNSVTVDVEGNVIMCCRDYESRVKFGNLLKNNINEIRNSEKFKGLLGKQKNCNFSSEICNKCDNSFDSSLNWWGEFC